MQQIEAPVLRPVYSIQHYDIQSDAKVSKIYINITEIALSHNEFSKIARNESPMFSADLKNCDTALQIDW
jgi:hypothetical protein